MICAACASSFDVVCFGAMPPSPPPPLPLTIARQPLAAGLYIVATPIGHLRDISLRALDVLASAELVLCEDTRRSRKLFAAYGLAVRCLSYHEHNAAARRPQILARLAKGAALGAAGEVRGAVRAASRQSKPHQNCLRKRRKSP